MTSLQELRSVRRSHLLFVFQLFGQYIMEDSGESDVFSERDEWSVSSDSYDDSHKV